MKRVIIAILVVAAAASCRKSELQVEEHGKINLSTAVAGFDEHFPQRPDQTQNRAASKTNSASKADATDFPIGQTLGLYLHTDNPIGTAARCHSQNIEYATPDGGTTWNQRASLDAPINDGTTYYATAYSPFVEGAFEPTAMALAVATDQSIGDALERSDLRIARNTPISGSGDTFTATLDFTHALAMFELKLLIPQMVEGREVDQIEAITFENMATKGTINLATGAITTDLNSVASVKPRIVSGTGLIGVMTTYQAIVVPQNVDGNVLLAKIRCRMKDGSTETMDYVTPSRGWISFRSGVKTSITLMPTAEAAFMGDLPELMDGQAHTDLALPIFVETGLRWTIDAPGCTWLTLSDAAGGTYGEKLSGTSATGAWQNIFVKVSANTSQTMPRTGDLLLRAWRADGSEVPAAVLRLVQNYYTFSPVGGTWNTSAAAASDPVQPFASNQQWTAESDAAWLLLATSANPGSGNPTRKYTHVGALEADKLFVQVLANNSATARRGVVTISSPVVGAAPMKIYVNQMGNQPYIEIGGLRWATGNLVATRSSVDGVSAPGCMIGAPDDGGLYFQFGSLIGYKGGANDYKGTGTKLPDASMSGKAWNGAAAWSWENDAMVWPNNLSGKPSAWPQGSTTNQWYFGLQTGWSTFGQNIRDYSGFASGGLANLGVGDPCTYYLGGTWRLPTSIEQTLIMGQAGNNWVAWTVNGLTARWVNPTDTFGGISGPGAWFGPGLNANSGTPNPSNNPFLPAALGRMTLDGLLANTVAISSYCWSNSVYSATVGCALLARQGVGIVPQHNSARSMAAPVRCVQPVPTVPTPPAESDYVEINGLYWAKGNLVATNNTNAKVGKPEDGGLYFQFGSLIGYKGGATANGGTGVGIPDGPMQTNGAFWNGASAWSWGNEAGLWPDKLEGQPTAWPQGLTTNQWYFGVQSGWNALGKNIREYTGFTEGSLANTGVGDPCTYYLGKPWRLPTAEEYCDLFRNKYATGPVGTVWPSYQKDWGSPQANNQGIGVIASSDFSNAVNSPTPGRGIYANTNATTAAAAAADPSSIFFPASGFRFPNTGTLVDIGCKGFGRNSAVTNVADNGCYLSFTTTYVSPISDYGRSTGLSVRCVANPPHKPTPPAADEYVEINGLKWATGNLVAANQSNAKIGAPTDYGLYFIFGSLVGWSGGANGNGTGMGSPSLAIKLNPSTYTGSTSYAKAESYIGTTFSTGYDLPLTDNPTTGIGDPCRYYLSYPWRTPTILELASLTNTTHTTYVPWSNNITGKWAANGVGVGAWFGPGLLNGSGTTDIKKHVFFPASGNRSAPPLGDLYYPETQIYMMSASVANASYNYNLHARASDLIPVNSTNAYKLGRPVRCVSGMNVNPMDDWAAGPATESRTITISGISGSWSAAKSGTDAATLQLSSTSGPNEGTLTLTWPANNSTTVRSASITITSGAQSYTFATRQYGTNAIKVNGLMVAKGNLVADGQNSCKVGAPSDHGVYFQFGSLIGWKGGALVNGGSGVGATPYTTYITQFWNGLTSFSWSNDAMVWPKEMTSTPSTWKNAQGSNVSSMNEYHFAYSIAPWETANKKISDFDISFAGDSGKGTLGSGRYITKGIGDPCSYYLGASWHVPTRDELVAMIGLANVGSALYIGWGSTGLNARWVTSSQTFSGISGPGTWIGPGMTSSGTPDLTKHFFIPAAGVRAAASGAFANVNLAGSCWSGNVFDHTRVFLFDSHPTNGIFNMLNAGSGRSNAYPVRCVGQ